MSYHALVSVNHATNGGVYYCADFTLTGAQPTWIKLTTTGLPSLLLEYFRVDYGDPTHKQFCKIGDSIYYRNNSSWSEILNVASAATVAGASPTNANIISLWTDPTTPGTCYTILFTDPAPMQDGEGYVMKSTDYGATWAAYLSYEGRAAMGEVVAVGNNIWVSGSKLLLAGSGVNYSDDGGANWKGATGVGSYGDKIPICILPHKPNELYSYIPSGALVTKYSAGAYTTRVPAVNPTVSTRTDCIYFIADGSYGIAVASGKYWYSTDDFATATEINLLNLSDYIAAATFAYNAPGLTTAAAWGQYNGTQRILDTITAVGDTGNDDRAGTNTGTPPYTDAVPNVGALSVYGIWFGSPPANKGVFVYSVEEDKITDLPSYTGLGTPMFGDRSSWRDLDADDDGLIPPTPLADYHAQDIQADTPQRHNPWPAASGYAPVSDGTKYVATDVVTQAEMHNPVTLDADAAVILDITAGQELGLDTQTANTVLAGPTSGAANEPTFRALVLADIPAEIALSEELHQHTYQEDHSDECDGVETNFITANQFEDDTTMWWLNGVLQLPDVDYTEDATLDAVTFTTAPSAGDILLCAYIADLEI